MPATWRQAVLVPGKLGAFPSSDAAAPRVRDREEGVRRRGVVLAVGVGEEKPRAGTTVDLVMSPDACRRRLDGLRCVTPHQQATGHSSALVLFRPTRAVAWCGRADHWAHLFVLAAMRFVEERKWEKALLNP